MVLSNWSTLVEGLSASTQDSYDELETALEAREVPDLAISRVEYSESGIASAKREYLRIQRKEFVFDVCAAPFGKSFFFSWWMAIPPLPLAPLWTLGFFFAVVFGSTLVWFPFRESCFGVVVLVLAPLMLTILFLTLMKVGVVFSERVALRIPLVGWLYRLIFSPPTYYNADTQAMFEASVHQSLLDVIDGKISAQGLRALAPEDRRPSRRSKFGLSDILNFFK